MTTQIVVGRGSLRAGKLALPDLQKISDHPDRYYDLNWVWFGIAADEGLLVQSDRLQCVEVPS